MRRLMSAPEVYWATWLASSVTGFCVLETLAVRRRSFPTLSRTLAKWMGCHPRTRWGHVGPAVFLAFWTALTVHVARIR
jgi:hypothetical protein